VSRRDEEQGEIDDRIGGERQIPALPEPGLPRYWKYAVLISGALACAALVLGPVLFKKITDERTKRIDTVSQIVEQGCVTDNNQDLLLANLLTASLNPEQQFGEGIPAGELTAFDVQVIDSIARISELSAADAGNEMTATFEQARDELLDTVDCDQLVAAYRNAGELPDVAPAELPAQRPGGKQN
jgi:hypothetical protein